ncbi:hypothetical protein Btru_050838 [Bulinus truncatus]|nr:hypothetical protein Btru_050838 [Bulinus truncatus]
MDDNETNDELVSNLVKIESLPNLRLLCKKVSSESSEVYNAAAIYRSSKPDRIVVEDLEKFRRLGIKCIVDFRSKDEYLSTDGHCLIDAEYTLYKVCLPKDNYSPGEKVTAEVLSKPEKRPQKAKNPSSLESGSAVLSRDGDFETTEKRHYLINFFTARNKFKNFTKLIVQKAVNSKGIYGQYIGFIENSQSSICAALKLVSDPDNLPVLINCAHGKDRTGIMSALILTCLGMTKNFVAGEYALSTEGLEPVRHLVYRDIVEKYELREEFCTSETETMLKLLNYIEEKYVSVEDYLCYIGFSREEQHRLKTNVEAHRHVKPLDVSFSKSTTITSTESNPVLSHQKYDQSTTITSTESNPLLSHQKYD